MEYALIIVAVGILVIAVYLSDLNKSWGVSGVTIMERVKLIGVSTLISFPIGLISINLPKVLLIPFLVILAMSGEFFPNKFHPSSRGWFLTKSLGISCVFVFIGVFASARL